MMIRRLIACAMLFSAVIAAAEPLKVGVITDLSGPMAEWGRQTRLGAELGSEEINAGGAQFALVFGDHQLQAKSAASEMRKLINIDRVDAVFSDFSAPSAAAAPIAGEAGVLFLYSAVGISALSANPDAFKTLMDYRSSCLRIVEYWKAEGVSRIGILKPNTEFGELCLRGAAAAVHDIIEENYNPGDDVRTQVLSLKRKQVQAVIHPGYEPDHLRMFKALREYKFFPFLAMQEDDLSPANKDAYRDLIQLTVFFGFDDISPQLQTLLGKRAGAGVSSSHIAARLAYLHIKQLYFALAACPERTLQCRKEALAGSPPDEDLGFLGWKDRVARFSIPLKKWAGGRSVSLFAERQNN